jgi:hypothetical protein
MVFYRRVNRVRRGAAPGGEGFNRKVFTAELTEFAEVPHPKGMGLTAKCAKFLPQSSRSFYRRVNRVRKGAAPEGNGFNRKVRKVLTAKCAKFLPQS